MHASAIARANAHKQRERNWNESAKAFANALKQDTDNVQLLRELELMQYLGRDLDGLCDTTRRLVTLKPGQAGHWHAFAVAMHLNGHHAFATDICSVWLQMKEDNDPFYAKIGSVEKTQFHLFLARVIDAAHGADAALAHLAKYEAIVWDKTGLWQARAQLYGKLERREDEAACYRTLLDEVNAENLDYFTALRAALSLPRDGERLDDAQCAQWLAELERVAAVQPRAALPPRLALRCIASNDGEANDADFTRRADALARPLLRKGVAAAYSALGDATASAPRRVAQLTALVDSYVEALRSGGRFPDAAADSKPELPSVLFWALYLRAQCAMAVGDIEATLKWLDEAEAHTPTVIELFSFRALVLKRAGDLDGAFEEREKARRMDLADRYLNNKSAKYALRAGRRKTATKLLGMFTKQGDDPERYLHDMQCTWFELEAAACHYRAGEIGNN